MMKVTSEQLVSKAGATVEALKLMAPKDLEPTNGFAEDFNNFRKLVVGLRPDLEEVAPKQLEIPTSSSNAASNARYVEILAYYMQFMALLNTYPAK